MGKKIELDREKVIHAIGNAGGVVRKAAAFLNVSKQTLYNYLDRNEDVMAVLKEIRGKSVEIATDAIHEIAQDPEHRDRFKAARLLAETFGRDEGWAPTKEHHITGKGGGPIKHVVGVMPTTEQVNSMTPEQAVLAFDRIVGMPEEGENEDESE